MARGATTTTSPLAASGVRARASVADHALNPGSVGEQPTADWSTRKSRREGAEQPRERSLTLMRHPQTRPCGRLSSPRRVPLLTPHPSTHATVSANVFALLCHPTSTFPMGILLWTRARAHILALVRGDGWWVPRDSQLSGSWF
jgi:hypothetical protein